MVITARMGSKIPPYLPLLTKKPVRFCAVRKRGIFVWGYYKRTFDAAALQVAESYKNVEMKFWCCLKKVLGKRKAYCSVFHPNPVCRGVFFFAQQSFHCRQFINGYSYTERDAPLKSIKGQGVSYKQHFRLLLKNNSFSTLVSAADGMIVNQDMYSFIAY